MATRCDGQNFLIHDGQKTIKASLEIPSHSRGLVIIANYLAQGRFAERNEFMVDPFHEAYLATVLVDLLADGEIQQTGAADISLFANRIIETHNWLLAHQETTNLPIAYLGNDIAAAAVIEAAAILGEDVKAVVCISGRIDPSNSPLQQVVSPACLIVGDNETEILDLNQEAFREINAEKSFITISTDSDPLTRRGEFFKKVTEASLNWIGAFLPRSRPREAANTGEIILREDMIEEVEIDATF